MSQNSTVPLSNEASILSLYPPVSAGGPLVSLQPGWKQIICADGVTPAKRNPGPGGVIYYSLEAGSITPVLKKAIQDALAAWSAASNGKLNFIFAGPNDPHRVWTLHNDNPGLFFQAIPGWLDGLAHSIALSQTMMNVIPNNLITQSNIEINTGPYVYHEGDPYFVPGTPATQRILGTTGHSAIPAHPNANPPTAAIPAVRAIPSVPARPEVKAQADAYLMALHEIGHCLGFDHNGDATSIMYPNIHAKTGVAGFSQTDLDGLVAVYG